MDIQGDDNEYCLCKNIKLPGFRFMPSDEELCNLYLRAKIDGKPLPCSHVIAGEFEIYKEDNTGLMPWDMIRFDDPLWFPSSDSSNGNLKTKKSLYFFTKLKMDGKHALRRVGSAATWKNQNKKYLRNKTGYVIGQKKLFSYDQDSKKRKKNIEDDQMHMIMHEYSLLDFPTYVLCKVVKDVIMSKATSKKIPRVSPYNAGMLDEIQDLNPCYVPNQVVLSSKGNHINFVEPKSAEAVRQYIGDGVEAHGDFDMVNNVDQLAKNNIDSDRQLENFNNAVEWDLLEDLVDLPRFAADYISYGRVNEASLKIVAYDDQRLQYTNFGVDDEAYMDYQLVDFNENLEYWNVDHEEVNSAPQMSDVHLDQLCYGNKFGAIDSNIHCTPTQIRQHTSEDGVGDQTHRDVYRVNDVDSMAKHDHQLENSNNIAADWNLKDFAMELSKYMKADDINFESDVLDKAPL